MELQIADRAAIQMPTLRTELVAMESLNGMAVVVRGRMLAQTLALHTLHASVHEPQPGESSDQAKVRAGAYLVAHTLAEQVVLRDGNPMWNAEQWAIHGGQHPQEVVRLHEVAQRLSGAQTEAVVKN